jgi:hypothetical protein
VTPEEKWAMLKQNLIEEAEWCETQMAKPSADTFFFFIRQCCVKDTLSYMMYLDGKDTEETKLLIALLGGQLRFVDDAIRTLLRDRSV